VDTTSQQANNNVNMPPNYSLCALCCTILLLGTDAATPSPQRVLDSSAVANDYCVGQGKIKVVHHHMSFHGGTTLCAIANVFNPCVRVPDEVRASACFPKQRLTPGQLTKAPFDFIMYEGDAGLSPILFPELRVDSVYYTVTIRHPLPLVLKLVKGGHGVDTPTEKWVDNYDLVNMLPTGESSSNRCGRAAMGGQRNSERARLCLSAARESLRKFEAVLILDHYKDSLRLFCAVMKWPNCADLRRSNEKNLDRYEERHQDIMKSVADNWPANSTSRVVQYDSLEDAYERNLPGVLFFEHAVAVSEMQMYQHGLTPEFTARGVRADHLVRTHRK
jgi:hypothetical protein